MNGLPAPDATVALKALARRWYEEIWKEARPEIADEIFAADYVHPRQAVSGPAGVKTHVALALGCQLQTGAGPLDR